VIEEKRGEFYIGKKYDGEVLDEPIRYDSKDLTTHGVCVGMTGSGKTGLCLSLLEEAGLDGVPAICIDPKGDLGNLLLTFPDLLPADFEPWIDPADADRKEQTVPERAKDVAEMWKSGLADWGQDGARIQRFRDAVDLSIYTPGSSAGLPISVLKGLSAPKSELDAEGLRERVLATVSGLLALVGIAADPVQSREHVFLSNIVYRAWEAGEDLAIGDLIRSILEPPFSQIGVLDVESFFPGKDRQSLAMKLNSLLASPSFAGWLEGEALDVQKLLYTDEGKPRVSIMSIAHLSEAERMFFVTLLLGEVVAWMRSQAGTSGLRALIYMDEVVGFLPPVAEPPSKKPLMTLLKQGRAYGVGCLLATQNPVDVDYKALSNCGTWFLGRLQTERDVDRVIDGLQGAAQVAGSTFDPQSARATLAGLKSRVFLMNNVHEGAPQLFHTRWALSYLRGPLTRQQISRLMADKRAALTKSVVSEPAAPPQANASDTIIDSSPPIMTGAMATEAVAATPLTANPRPIVPEGIDEVFLDAGPELVPALLAWTDLHYTKAPADLDHWFHPAMLTKLRDCSPSELWKDCTTFSADVPLLPESEGASYAEIPRGALGKQRLRSVTAALKSHCYKEHPVIIGYCKPLKFWSRIDEDREEFGLRLNEAANEVKQEEVQKVHDKHAALIAKVEAKIDRAEAKVDTEEAQLSAQNIDTSVSIGTAVLGAVFGRGSASGHVRRAASSAKRAGKVAKEKKDVARAKEKLEDLVAELIAAQAAGNAALQEAGSEPLPQVEERRIAPRKSDIGVSRLALAWVSPSRFTT
jgi:hypothetical protein